MKTKKLALAFTFIAVLSSNIVVANDGSTANTVITNGISFGTAPAIAISYTHNKSIMWAIIHGIFGWLYVIYFYFTKQ
jgi:hypothetical protein